MKKITKKKLNEILKKHKKWLERKEGGERADLSNADLSNAYLNNADLRYADLRNANLRNADLSDADLRYADLSNAYLSNAYSRYADLRYADLSNAKLRNAKNIPFIPIACPDYGSFIGYKKVRNNYIVELEILSDAKRCSATGRKCRCSKAKVLNIQNIDGSIAEITEVASKYDSDFIYKVGEIVEVPNFCEDRWQECAVGIHFFINRQEAVDYYC